MATHIDFLQRGGSNLVTAVATAEENREDYYVAAEKEFVCSGMGKLKVDSSPSSKGGSSDSPGKKRKVEDSGSDSSKASVKRFK
jgi:hypothetical protein